MKKGLRRVALALGCMVTLAHAAIPDRVVTRAYNAQGLLASVDGPRTDVSDITRYAYDSQGRLASLTNALSQVTKFDTYNAYGNPGRIIDANGVITLITYTPEGWIASTTQDSGGTPSTTALTYNAVGDVTQTKDADGVTVTYGYDDARRLTSITDAQGSRIRYTLDAEGNRLKEETLDAGGSVKRSLARTVNSLSQLLTLTDGLNKTVLSFSTTDGYDAAGHPVHSADALGIQRKRGYDALGRLVSTLDNYNGTDTATKDTGTVSVYDASDRLNGVSDPSGLNTIYSYNGLGDLTALSSPDTGNTIYTADAAGNRLTATDAKGVKRTYAYDALNRLKSISYADAKLNVAYGYDEPNSSTGCASSYPVGRLTRIVETAVTTVYCYDARGNVIEKRQTVGTATDTTRYAYTLANRLKSVTTPSKLVVQYTRDTNGRITTVTLTPPSGPATTAVSNVSYLPFGPVLRYTLGNGQVVTRSYDANYALTDISSPAFNWHVARNAMGQITAQGNATGANPATETYAYDPLYRLSSVKDASGKAIEAYTYNNTGDRLSKTATGLASGTYNYKANTHWLTSIGNAARTYDANGNTVSNVIGGDTFGYGYDGRNRLISVQRNGSTVGTYTYNAQGERVAKVATLPSAINQRYAYDQASQLLGEYGSSTKDYVWLDTLPVAVVDTQGTTSTPRYVIADGLNTPRAIADSTGKTVWQWSAIGNPFGEQPPTSSTGYIYNLRYPGQYYDAESRLHDNINRSFEPATGRYLQSDPLGLQAGPSTYVYVSGSPLNAVDPLGLQMRTRPPQAVEEETIPVVRAEERFIVETAREEAREERLEREWAQQVANGTVPGQRVPASQYGTNGTCRRGDFDQPTATMNAPSQGGVYALVDPLTGEIMYAGRTNDLLRRSNEHAADPIKQRLDFNPVFLADDYATQRGLEQTMINMYSPPLNVRNGISPSNPNYDTYMDAAQSHLQQGH